MSNKMVKVNDGWQPFLQHGYQPKVNGVENSPKVKIVITPPKRGTNAIQAKLNKAK